MKGVSKLVLGLMALVGLLIGGGGVFATDDSTVTGTIGNNAPTVGALTVTSSSLAPGASQIINVTVTDIDGNTTIDSVVLKCWGTGSVVGDEDDWDHLTNSSGTPTDVNSTAILYSFSLTASNHAINGTWDCNVTANDTSSSEASNNASFTMNTRVGISLETSTLTVSGNAGTSDNAFGENAITITHDGNININMSINGTDLTKGGDTIGVGNVTYYNSNDAGSSVALTGTSTAWITTFSRGTDPTANTTDAYYWLDVPSGTPSGEYSGSISLATEAS